MGCPSTRFATSNPCAVYVTAFGFPPLNNPIQSYPMKTILEITACLAFGLAFISAPFALRALLALLGLV